MIADDKSLKGAICLIEEGFACRHRTLPDGRRQILSFLVPGDLSDLRVFILGRTDSAVSTLSDVSVSVITPEHLLALTERYPRITRALWWSTLVEESITQEWLVNIGQRSALERMAHLLCELYVRLSAVAQVDVYTFDLPITQSELADTLGLSSVHVNRTLQELRRRELIVFRDHVMELKDVAELKKIAMFSPGYLHLRSVPSFDPAQKATPQTGGR
ncbi:Crp/Fnr family transcriptional regulator [Pelagibacterium xiamenense]|uniref:Crp/Fnr family transcriptional regulator n=1 Tax=Pelagibacterium xiamenense TaxID=2901140 RepID=UPI001E2C1970|nr:Crp/Fnr family transcriptional regulator [Pelagibacterium xiamenense]MCD7058655.1 Crp/Fnr family transcriptional regulator [Pelagibacterium xiamenense]